MRFTPYTATACTKFRKRPGSARCVCGLSEIEHVTRPSIEPRDDEREVEITETLSRKLREIEEI